MNLPETHTFTLKRNNATLMEGIGAQCLPSQDAIVAFQDIPANKLFKLICNGIYDIHEQDVLVSDADSSETYRVLGVAPFRTRFLAHTEATLERMWGS